MALPDLLPGAICFVFQRLDRCLLLFVIESNPIAFFFLGTIAHGALGLRAFFRLFLRGTSPLIQGFEELVVGLPFVVGSFFQRGTLRPVGTLPRLLDSRLVLRLPHVLNPLNNFKLVTQRNSHLFDVLLLKFKNSLEIFHTVFDEFRNVFIQLYRRQKVMNFWVILSLIDLLRTDTLGHLRSVRLSTKIFNILVLFALLLFSLFTLHFNVLWIQLIRRL